MSSESRTHQIVVNAYGHETDHQCRVTPQSYLRYMDRGRLEGFEEICRGLGVQSWLDTYIINVYKITARFAAPAYNGERLVVNSSLHKTSSHRAVFLQRVLNSRGAIAAEAFVELLFLDGESKQLVPIPDQLPASALPAIANERVLIPVPFNNQEHFKFQWPVRVYYEDTDAQQITYHVSYFNYCERAFLEYVRQCVGEGTFRGWLGTHQIRMVRQINRYMKATHLSEQLTVLLGLRALDENSLLLDERVVNSAGEVCTDMMSEIQILENGQVIPIPVSLGVQRL